MRPWIAEGHAARMVLRFRLDAEEQAYAGVISPALAGAVMFLASTCVRRPRRG